MCCIGCQHRHAEGDAVRNGGLVSREHEAWELPVLKGMKEEREGGEGNASKVTRLEDFFCERPGERKESYLPMFPCFQKCTFF